MYKKLLTFLVLTLVLLGSMITQGCRSIKQELKGITSSASGLDRTITLYTNDGSVIKTWSGKINVSTDGGKMRIILSDDRIVYIGGTYIIEENK